MIRGRIWFLHLYSCLRITDLEVLYQKMRKWGLELRSSNSCADCFEIKEGAETEYKIVPTSIPVDNINFEHWKLITKNNKYYILEYDKQCKEIEIFSANVNNANSYISEFVFLLAFPICVFYFMQKFNVLEHSVLPSWINYLFMIAICIIYLGHFVTLFTSFFQTRHYIKDKEKVKRSGGEFLLRIAISCIVNVLQIMLVIIVFWGITKS